MYTERMRLKGIINLNAEDNELPFPDFLYEISIDVTTTKAIPKYFCTLKISSKNTADKKTTNMGIN